MALLMAGMLFMAVTADDADIQSLAIEAQVDPIDLAGAVNETQMNPRDYLITVGDLRAPESVAPTNARVACIERKESGGANVANSHGSGAGGVMQYMASTFAAHAAEMGHPEWSRWNPDQARAVAAHDLALGRRAQWSVSGC